MGELDWSVVFISALVSCGASLLCSLLSLFLSVYSTIQYKQRAADICPKSPPSSSSSFCSSCLAQGRKNEGSHEIKKYAKGYLDDAEMSTIAEESEEKKRLRHKIEFLGYQESSVVQRVKNKLKSMHLTSINDLDNDDVKCIMEVAKMCRHVVKVSGGTDACKHNVLVTLFCEASTRTRCSFETAMYRLGGHVCTVDDVEKSSAKKGETLEDTIHVLSKYADVIVLRHPNKGAAKKASETIKNAARINNNTNKKYSKCSNNNNDYNERNVSLINGGDGDGEHPTQALLDLFTIHSFFPSILHYDDRPLTITFVGDLLYGRTVHSLARLLSRFNTKIIYAAPHALQVPDDVFEEVQNNYNKNGHTECRQKKNEDLRSALEATDVIYVTRVQKERFLQNGKNEKETETIMKEVKDKYFIDAELLDECAPSHAKVLHPLPRVDELNVDVDENKRAAYFVQSENGVYVRMALLALALDKADKIF